MLKIHKLLTYFTLHVNLKRRQLFDVSKIKPLTLMLPCEKGSEKYYNLEKFRDDFTDLNKTNRSLFKMGSTELCSAIPEITLEME